MVFSDVSTIVPSISIESSFAIYENPFERIERRDYARLLRTNPPTVDEHLDWPVLVFIGHLF